MKLRTFNSIGGLRLIGSHLSNDIFDLAVRRADISGLAVGMIDAIGADASPELIEKCREVVAFADEHLVAQRDENGFTPGQRAFIKSCEDNAGESKREGETNEEYYKRLEADYSGFNYS